MNMHTFVIGNEEFQMMQLNAFKANSYLLKMKGLISNALSSGMNTNALNLMSLIDEETFDKVIFPLFRDCAVTCTSQRKKVDGPSAVNDLFTADDLDQFYLLVLEVLKFNFAPFLSKMAMSLFGLDLSQSIDQVKASLRNLGASSSAKISTQSTGSGVQ